ncbi:hypothetical protein [Streptomyces genisteinicus]|uniref:Uncharacterized protein n=1 Tax=Streptomyces genisteinicus TaxID=2768068 RepID=A0A7H0I5B6_9ACTN|nr:hypothetical protein [Streptomyces genisteinicus]QNP67982.1 hypothetical protein IAG43_34010 [Streptomyces genisteinicus]
MQAALPLSWNTTAPWLLVVTIIVIVISLQPDSATIGSCTALLLGAAEAQRRLTA